jgi:signal transduction histidine kinase
MESPLQQILNLLIQPPGNLIYHLVLAFSIVSALQAALIGKRTSKYAHTNRIVLGLTMLLVGQVTLYLSSGLAWQGIMDERIFLPALDRAIIFLSLVWIIWLWNFPAPARLGDLVTGFLVLGAVIFFFFTYSSWSEQALNTAFNTTWLDWSWVAASAALAAIGMAVLLFSRPPGWSFGLGMLALSLAGLVTHLLLVPNEGFLSGFIRLGQLAAFPLLPTLLHRLNPPAADATSDGDQRLAAETHTSRNRERRRYSSDPRTTHAWLLLLEQDDPEKTLSGMAKAFSHTMLADMCYIVGEPAYGHLVLQSGYDLIREETVAGTMIDQSLIPPLTSAIQRGKALRITEDTPQPPDTKPLCSAIGLTELGSLMYIPLLVGEKPHGGILFLSPYSKRQWTIDDQEYLASEYELVAQIIDRARQSGSRLVEETSTEQQFELETLRMENQRLSGELASLHSNGHNTAQDETGVNLAALIALQQETQIQISALQSENERLQEIARQRGDFSSASSPDMANAEAELRVMLQETAHLQNQLAEANARNLMFEREMRQYSNVRNEDLEVVTSIIQEIRQPMSSIVGYTELLLSESVGILGTLQRKFLERIKASVERMHGTLNDLIRVASMGQRPIELMHQPVVLDAIVDQAVADTSAQLREKNIALRVDLPEELPQIYADRDAIQQIVLQLLQNAGAATPPEGSIALRARMNQDNDQEFLLIQVSDTGGGVHPDDLPRVFSRRYRADMPLIQGLGDTGVGLSIAKTLVEAHRGRIWVDSAYGQGTTFSVLMPVDPNPDSENLK